MKIGIFVERQFKLVQLLINFVGLTFFLWRKDFNFFTVDNWTNDCEVLKAYLPNDVQTTIEHGLWLADVVFIQKYPSYFDY
jgi:hypothetical protein